MTLSTSIIQFNKKFFKFEEITHDIKNLEKIKSLYIGKNKR